MNIEKPKLILLVKTFTSTLGTKSTYNLHPEYNWCLALCFDCYVEILVLSIPLVYCIMVIGSFASYTKTKSVESAVWCLLTLDDDGVEQRVLERVLAVSQGYGYCFFNG